MSQKNNDIVGDVLFWPWWEATKAKEQTFRIVSLLSLIYYRAIKKRTCFFQQLLAEIQESLVKETELEMTFVMTVK